MARILAFAGLCLLALTSAARADPITIVNNTPCTVTGTVGFAPGCSASTTVYGYGPWSRGTVYPDNTSGCMIAAMLAGVDCGNDGAAKCGQFASNGVPPDQWKFQVNGDAKSGCYVVQI
jgi:hypothetical protein